MRTLPAAFLLALFPLMAMADKPAALEFEVTNHLTFDRAPSLVHRAVSHTGKARLLEPDGKELACHYDMAAKKLLFIDGFKAGETRKYRLLSEEPKVKPPKWVSKPIKDDLELEVGKKKFKSAGGQVENGLLRARVMRNSELRTELEVTSLSGGYKFRCNPLGSAVGCIDDPKYAPELEELVKSGGGTHPQLMNVYFGLPEKVEILEPNPFQRVIKATCVPFAVKSNKETPEVVSEASMSVTLTWGSPVIEVNCRRKVAKTYYNHNGVFLNEFYLPQFPVEIFTDGETAAKRVEEKTIASGALDTKCKKFMLLRHPEGKVPCATLICVPDFERSAIEGPRFSAFRDRMMTVISQSWHLGWKPIEIKAQDYDDKLVLACHIGASLTPAKTYGDWAAEIEKPLE